MKYIKKMHTILGLIPFAWFISFLLILIIGTIHFGYIPKYGNHVDPFSLNIGVLSSIHFGLYFFGFISFFLWIVLAITILLFSKEGFSPNKLSSTLFLLGVSGFFIFKYIFTESFLWVFD